ncbi:MAG: hypothetical protein H0V76_10015, partial [Blastocatellia bacterium]|nr:hypothetical protein [Blastocatellia bacterium]
MALFGWDRFNATLSADARPLTVAEIEDEVERFERFIEAFSGAEAVEHVFAYVVVRIADGDPLTNVQKWYELDEGEDHGHYRLYSSRLRTTEF